MANYNLADYETVEQRLKRFWAAEEHADARIVTVNHTTLQDRQVSTWVVEARIYLTAADQEKDLPKATGWAFEVDGSGMANKTSALENAETSAIGRALANMNYSGNKRTSREEMEKVARDTTPKPVRDWVGEAANLEWAADVSGLRKLYADAVAAKAGADVVEKVKQIGERLSKAKGSTGGDS